MPWVRLLGASPWIPLREEWLPATISLRGELRTPKRRVPESLTAKIQWHRLQGRRRNHWQKSKNLDHRGAAYCSSFITD